MQVGIAQVGIAQVGRAQVGSAQVGRAQVGRAQAVESVFFEDGFDAFAFESAVWCGDFHCGFLLLVWGVNLFPWVGKKGLARNVITLSFPFPRQP